MNAPEDAELHLQRASADLLREFSSSLPRFLWLSPKVGQQSDGEQGPSARKIVKERSTEQLIKLVCPTSIRSGAPGNIVLLIILPRYIVGAFSGMASTAGSSSQSFHIASQFCFPRLSVQPQWTISPFTAKAFYRIHTLAPRDLQAPIHTMQNSWGKDYLPIFE